MGSKLIQPSFSGGELDPSLAGRVDLARYGISVKTGSRFIVRPAGGALSGMGSQFIGEVDDSTKTVRLLPFEVSAETAYVCVLEEGKAQFIYRGEYIVDGMAARVEITTPYQEADLPDVHITQSADTMFMVHPNYPPRRIARLTASSFETGELVFREGPFRTINSDEARKLAVSGKTGTVTLTSNFDLFTSDHVGSLVYLEQKALGIIKPWVQGERTPNLALGVQRRSDGKVYTLTTLPSATSWTETGNVRPTHETGREWDGAGDTRISGTFEWAVGVEWEYAHSGYGIALITAFTDARTVTAVVKRTMPDGVVGGFGAAANTWPLTGDGVTVTFAVAGATSTSQSNYTVTFDGVPVESDPNYPGGGGVGGGGGGPCVHVDSRLPGGLRAGDVQVGDTLTLIDPETLRESTGTVSYSQTKEAPLWRITTSIGVTLVCSDSAPIPTLHGDYKTPANLMGQMVPVCRRGVIGWDAVTDVSALGLGPVQHITVGDRCFWAGEERGGYIAHHNAKDTDPYS
jgi:hypothetical protein